MVEAERERGIFGKLERNEGALVGGGVTSGFLSTILSEAVANFKPSELLHRLAFLAFYIKAFIWVP